jgi:two-component system sensor histidine kinase/response regulator
MKALQELLIKLPKFRWSLNIPIEGLSQTSRQRVLTWKQQLSRLTKQLRYQYNRVRLAGVMPGMEYFEKRKLSVFNQLNLLQFIGGILVPFTIFFSDKHLSGLSFVQTLLPAFVSLLVLVLNSKGKYEAASICYFLLYPFLTSVIYMAGMNFGVELYFILYGILSVFFIQEIGMMLFSVSLSMVSYFVLSVIWKDYHYQLSVEHPVFFMFNQLLAVLFIFYGLYLIKRENNDYQVRLVKKGKVLESKNQQISFQKQDILAKAALLETQATKLQDSLTVKDKLFSVIAHDLKTPMYALRNLFQNVQQYDLSGEEIKEMVPDVMNDLNYTTGLMENLLQWAKNQMQKDAVRPQMLDLTNLSNDVLQLLRLQASSKSISVKNIVQDTAYAFADRDMVHLVLRNLVANAIKFTPENGVITIGINELPSYVEVYVQDTGVGISRESIRKIRQGNYFTTNGTTNESGTGLGLMLCKEFIQKNGGNLFIESEEGKGSVFSFTLPTGEEKWATATN